MITLEKGMCISDVEQWVGGGVFLLKIGDGTLAPASVTYFPCEDEGDDDGFLNIEIASGGGTHIPMDSVEEYIFPHWPMCGSVNLLHHKFAMHFERLQMKQWRRTFNWRQIKAHMPQRWSITQGGNFYHQTGEIVNDIFNPEYPELGAVLEWFEDGWKTVALSPFVIVCNTQPRTAYYNGLLACKLCDDGTFDPIDVRLTAVLSKAYPEGIVI